MNTPILSSILDSKKPWVFPMLWVLTFILYIAAGKAGWVIDASGFIYNLKHQNFWDFINRTHSDDQSFYQVLTLQYFVGYKLWGMNVWLWSLLYITLQAANAYLLFVVCRNIFSDSGLKNSVLVPLIGVLFFTVCPHISEVLICKAYYHYLQCFLFILLIMLWVQKYQHNQRSKYIWGAAILFLLSTFTLEIFYIIPIFVLTIALFYRFGLDYDKQVFRKTVLYFFIPQLLLLCVYFIALFATYKNLKAHKIEVNQSTIDYLSKLPKYLFHIIFLGRYFAPVDKNSVYRFCESPVTIAVFYGLAILTSIYAIVRFSRMNNTGKVMFLLFVWVMMTLLFVMPLAFPGSSLLVFYDRYTYFAEAFLYILLVLIVSHLVTNKYIAILIFCIYVDFNLYFTINVNSYWMQSSLINNKLIHNFPDPGDKIVLLLNTPENYNGAPMIGAQPDGIFKAMHDVYTDTVIKSTLYEVASFNMVAENDGAHVTVINDSVLHVTLNQFGSWWWYEGHGAKSYENADYKVNMVKPNYWYEITLKHPADKYLLLYALGDKWKTVDMNKKNEDQWQ